ncbi:hypothetical protein TrRE_jg4505 [Triparma retinervis]|uniref:Uncharacterized protein n=1 Tax=Triparma retinervis TaxID=2557542 RepID=A0A9W7FBC9_9STRA|nr:hypothetical protein TrRE_jg4505 [Triparma retinervis]
MAVAAAGSPQSNNSGWCTKFMVYVVLVVGSMFTPSYVFDQHGFLNIARVGGAVFTVIQQIILIDLAYNFNDKFVANADEDDKNEPGSGLAIILASMAWTITSYASSMTEMFTSSNAGAESLIEEGGQQAKEPVTGVVTGGDSAKYGATASDSNVQASTTGGEAFSSVRDSVGGDFDGGQSWKLNLVLALMSTWFPMVLTSWGAVNENGTAANTTVGEVSMWMIVAAQWTALVLYSWTLLAPRLFPDRDFGQ